MTGARVLLAHSVTADADLHVAYQWRRRMVKRSGDGDGDGDGDCEAKGAVTSTAMVLVYGDGYGECDGDGDGDGDRHGEVTAMAKGDGRWRG